MQKQWLYKKNETPKIFEGDEITKALKKGWVDCPAKAAAGKKTVVKKITEE